MASLWAELKTLFWLQWKLTASVFRRRSSVEGWARLAGVILRLLQLIFTFPFFVLLGAGMAVGMALLRPHAAYELAMIVNTAMVFIWLVLPSTYSSQLMERFEMGRLFSQPISFRGIVAGSTLMAMVSMVGLWTIPLLAGEAIGFVWHAPLAAPLIVLGAIPTFMMLVLAGRIIEDVFDLVAGDRRLRAVMVFILTAPFVLIFVLQYYLQIASDSYQEMPSIIGKLISPAMLDALGRAHGASDVLETLKLSRLLIWLPPGWGTSGMGLGTIGQAGRSLIFFALSVGGVGALYGLHAAITRRLMQGTTVSIGAERVRSRGFRGRLPGPPEFWALFNKDWIYLLRSPMPRRLLFAAPVAMIGMAPALLQMRNEPGREQELLPAGIALFVLIMLNLIVDMSLSADYYGVIDREGFAALALSPLDRRYILASGNLVVTVFVMAFYVLLFVVLGSLTGRWELAPLGIYTGLCLQISTLPAYNLASIMGPYRAQLKTGGRQRGNVWGILGQLSAPPVLALVAAPYALWRPGLIITLPLAAIYSVAIYVATLKPLARLMQQREYRILEAITSDE